MSNHILLLDSPDGGMQKLTRTLRSAAPIGAEIEVYSREKELLARLDAGLPYDMILLDAEHGDGSVGGHKLIKLLRKRDSVIPIIATAEEGSVDGANKAIQAGASDFLVRGGLLKKRVETLLAKADGFFALMERNRILDEQNRLRAEADSVRYRIIGESDQIREVIDKVERVAMIPRPVLILGERGTGKELVARAVHDAGGDPGRPFVAVNCAAFTDTLLESELFGHEKGAFTGADRLTHGKFEQARGGTLFLDEIGNMSLPFQQKILRVVEYGAFTRVGGRSEVKTDARIIAATNADLKAKMKKGEFLRDLYDRLTFEILRVPPLREREGDIPILARHFLHEFMREIPTLGGKCWSHAATVVLQKYPFPGNVRELKNIVERAAYRDVTNEITPVDIGMLPEAQEAESAGGTFEEQVEALERRLVREALGKSEGNQAAAARSLGLTYHQFRYYLKKYGKE